MSPDQRRLQRVGRALKIPAAGLVVLVAVVIAVRPSLLTTLKEAVTPGPDTVTAAEMTLPVLGELPADAPKYLGISVKLADSTDAIASFTSAVGVTPSVQLTFQAFGDRFNTTVMRQIVAEGRLPMLTWEPYDWRDAHKELYPLKAMAAGQYDEYLKTEAAKFAALGSPFVLRFAHEMNGDWYPWGAAAGTNTTADYVAAYRHVHDVVTSAGATNVLWMWSPNLTDAEPDLTLASLYPGDEYVDWVGLSGYYRQDTDVFTSRFTDTLAQLDTVAPTKPIFLAETAVGDSPNRIAQINDLVNGVAQTPRFIGMVWFNIDATGAWSIDDDPEAATALGTALRANDFSAVFDPDAAG
jgi:mannan endo-1,4-beta-mannosidase